MSMDLSSRHLPDLSESSMAADFSNASFQIPVDPSSRTNLLLGDDSFFHGIAGDEALVTPAPYLSTRTFQPPLTLDELTPRSQRFRAAPVRSSLNPRPNIPSPLKPKVARDLSIALEEALSPLKQQDITFSIPSSASTAGNLMSTEDSAFLHSGSDVTFTEDPAVSSGAHETLTLSQLTPGPSRIRRSPTLPPVPVLLSADLEGFSTQEPGLWDSRHRTNESTNALPLEGGSISTPWLSEPLSQAVPIADEGPTGASLPVLLDISESAKISPTANAHDQVGANEATLISKPQPSKQGSRRMGNSREKTQTKAKRTVIEGGIDKRSNLKLPTSSLTRSLSKAGRKPNSTAALEPRMADRNATQKRLPNSLRQNSGMDAQVQLVPGVVSGGLTAALMSYGQKTAVAGPDHSTVRQESAISLTEPNTVVPEPDVSRKGVQPEVVQPSPTSQLADQDCNPDQYRSSAGTNPIVIFSDGPPDAVLKGTAQSPAPDCTSDLSSRRPNPLSEIPLNPVEHIPDPASSAVPPSPMRPSVKRRSSPGPNPLEEQPRKKGKDNLDDVFTAAAPRQALPQSKPTSRQLKTSQRPRVKVGGIAASRSATAAAEARGAPKGLDASAGIASAPTNSRSRLAFGTHAQPNERQRHLTASSSRSIHDHALINSASSTLSVASRSGDPLGEGPATGNEPRRLPLHSTALSAASDEVGSSLTRPTRRLIHDQSTHPPPKPAKPPYEFTFSLTDSRPEAGKPETQARSKGLDEFKRSLKAIGLLPIPDYKKMHAVQEMELASRRDQIVPVVPVAHELHTDIRAHERVQFEEGLRARQKETEKLAEEKRRLEKLEEEREIRELRRRAVPKANEVPEWYQHAPKRVHKEDDGSRVGSVSK